MQEYITYSQVYLDRGLGAKAARIYQSRRKNLIKKTGCLTVIYGLNKGPGAENPWVYVDSRTYQEPLLIHLTGINQLKVALLLDTNGDEILFLPAKDITKEFWDGVRLGVGDPASEKLAKKITGFKAIHNINELESFIIKRLKKQSKNNQKIGLFWHHNPAKNISVEDSNFAFKTHLLNHLKQNKIKTPKIINIADIQWDLRLPLDETDVKNTIIANKKTHSAFINLLKNMHHFTNESQARGFLDGCMAMHSSYGFSFPTIAAAGNNATTLHYTKNDESMSKNSMILLDFGIRWMNMHADISRTIPINGKFNPLQKILYNIALQANLLVEKSAHEGVTIAELNEQCWSYINHQLEEKIRKKGGKFKLRYKNAPHGVSHLMGEQEHDGDPFGLYKNQPMKIGWLISNEPGIYGDFKIKIGSRTYDEPIGIRIEDNLLIKKNHCQNLSAGCPKSIQEIETIMATGKSKNKKINIEL